MISPNCMHHPNQSYQFLPPVLNVSLCMHHVARAVGPAIKAKKLIHLHWLLDHWVGILLRLQLSLDADESNVIPLRSLLIEWHTDNNRLIELFKMIFLMFGLRLNSSFLFWVVIYLDIARLYSEKFILSKKIGEEMTNKKRIGCSNRLKTTLKSSIEWLGEIKGLKKSFRWKWDTSENCHHGLNSAALRFSLVFHF